jgi:plastocyanin
MNVFRSLLLLSTVAASGAFAQGPATGAIAGTIRYVGVVPPSQRVALTDGQILLHNDIVVHPKTKGLRDLAIVLQWKEKAPLDAKAKPVVVDQRGMLFVPRVVTVQEGQKVRFENNDLYNHGVSAQSIHEQNAFNMTTPAGQPYEHKFKAQKNPIPIGCALHPWMRAYVIVAPHPYHAVTNAEGNFRLDHVPAGEHTLLLVHPDTNYRETISVEVQAGQTAKVLLEWKKLKN